MRLLHISAQKPDYTGSGIYLSGVMKGMDKFGFEQALIAGIDKSDNIDDIKSKYGFDFQFYPVVYNRNLHFNVPGMSDNMPYPSTRYRDMDNDMSIEMKHEICKTLKKAIEEFRPDAVICHHLYYATAIVRETVKDIPVIGVCHGTCIRQLHTNAFERDYIIENIRKLDVVCVLHKEQKDQVKYLFGIDEDKIAVIGSGYDNVIFNSEKRDKKNPEDKKLIEISYAGKLSYSKGLMEFLEAVDRIESDDFRLKIYFAGSGSNEKEVESIKKKASHTRHETVFAGRLNQIQLADLLRKTDIFVLPSFYEGLPLVILEAMACGNYVVATDIPGVKEWLGSYVTDSGLIDFVNLPKMKDITTPDEKYIDGFVEELKSNIIKAAEYRLENRENVLDAGYMSWKSIAEKIVYEIEKAGKNK